MLACEMAVAVHQAVSLIRLNARGVRGRLRVREKGGNAVEKGK